jgi:hypothetical protein
LRISQLANDLAVFDEETAQDILQTIAALKASGLLEPATSQLNKGNGESTAITSPAPIVVYNDSGETIPPYSIMQMTTALNEQGRNSINVKKPIDSTLLRCPMLINGHTEIASGGYGIAQNGPVYRIACGSLSFATGDRLGPTTGSWNAGLGSMFAVIGTDEIDSGIAKAMFDTSAFRGVVQTGGLVVGSTGNVRVYGATGTLDKTYVAETVVSNIASGANVILFSYYGRWLALELC